MPICDLKKWIQCILTAFFFAIIIFPVKLSAGVSITWVEADFPPIWIMEGSEIQQVLSNLINNAWEAIGENKGTVDLTVKMYSHADIPTLKRFPINWQPLEIVYACLQVSDTGHGIMNKDIERIFDPFFTTRFTGRGLGLPVVMGMVKAHGGGVTVDSEPGQGSVFRVFLPVSTQNPGSWNSEPLTSDPGLQWNHFLRRTPPARRQGAPRRSVHIPRI